MAIDIGFINLGELLLAAAANAFLLVIVSFLVHPPKRNDVKNAPYECGEIALGSGRVQLVMQYYSYVIMFLVLDLLSMFLLTWASAFKLIDVTSSIFMLIFLAILLPPIGYALALTRKWELWRL
jgi:NADH-quinone oxidoreductase subunit A